MGHSELVLQWEGVLKKLDLLLLLCAVVLPKGNIETEL